MTGDLHYKIDRCAMAYGETGAAVLNLYIVIMLQERRMVLLEMFP